MRRSIGLGVGMAMVAALLAGCGAAGTVPGAIADLHLVAQSHHRCTLAGGAPSIVLTDTTPSPNVTVRVGDRFVVTVPPWSSTHATPVSAGEPGVAVEVCSVLLKDGGRRSIFVAQHAGTSSLNATVAPASGLFMPAWGGTVTVQPD
jgi:hypothetical protein